MVTKAPVGYKPSTHTWDTEFDSLFNSLKNIYPSKFTMGTPDEPIRVAQEVYQFALNQPEEFHQDLMTFGRTPDTINILKSFGADDEQVNQILGEAVDSNQWLAEKLKELQGMPWEERLIEIRNQAKVEGIELPKDYQEQIPEDKSFMEKWEQVAATISEPLTARVIPVGGGIKLSVSDIAGLIAIAFGITQGGMALWNRYGAYRTLPEYKALNDFAKANNIPKSSATYKDAVDSIRFAFDAYKSGNTAVANGIMKQFYTKYNATAMEWGAANNATQEVTSLINRGISAFIPTAPQSIAMVQGGLPINAASWTAMSIADKVALVQSMGLEGKVASKVWAELTPAEIETVTKVTPPVTPEVTKRVMSYEERLAEATRLEQENRAILATPSPSAGEISPAQLGMMSKNEHTKFMQNLSKKIDIESRIKQLRLSDEELSTREAARISKETQGRIAQLQRQIADLKSVGISTKTGKMRPTYQRAIETAEAELQAISRLPSVEGVLKPSEAQRAALAIPKAEVTPEVAKPPVEPEVGEAYEAQAEMEGLKEWLGTEPAARLTNLIKKTGWYKGEVKNLTLKQYRDITGKTEIPSSILTPDKKHVKWEYALDGIATELGYADSETLKAEIERVGEANTRIKELQRDIASMETEKPLETLPEPTEVAISPTGRQMPTPAQVTKTLDLFGKYIESPTTLNAWELTRELRRETLSGRAELLKARAQELIVEKGITTEEAIKQAIRETMSGELPVMATDYMADLTDKMREVLFNKVYQTLKDEPFEMMSTAQALTNALTGRAIPREPGIKGGSAYSRLQKVFGDQPQVMKALEDIATEKKTLENVTEGMFREIVEGGNPPIPIDQATADYLRKLSTAPLGQAYLSGDRPSLLKLMKSKSAEEIAKETSDLRIELAPEPQPPSPPYEPPIEDALKQMPLFPRPAKDMVIKILKEIGMSPIDIGNFLRANKASFDFSFWRQQAPLIASHPISFVQANIEAWKALWSQKSTEASWEHITRDPLYQIYEECEGVGGDFLRPIELKKGTAQWRGVEEYGYLTGERLIPRLTAKLPWVKLSARAFEIGTNVHNWLIFKTYHKAMLKLNEMYASGQKTMKEGEAFDITKEMVDFSKSLANFSARGSLGKFAATAPELSGLFFAPRAAVGRILSVKDLLNANPRVRTEAWKNAATFISVVGGIILLGATMGWWSVEKDPRSAEYMSIRIGNTRIDPWGGFRQFLVFFTRAITGTGVSSVTGAEYEADPISLMQTFIRGKASPLASTILDFWRGKNFVGEEVDVKNKEQWVERMAPFAVWDIYEAYRDDPTTASISAVPAIVGAGVQTYTGDWNENFQKLGLPKYEENLPYGSTEPVYDIKDWWSDTVSQFKGVDPATLTEEKGFKPIVREAVEAKRILEELDFLPNTELIKINIDPSKGTTVFQYYKMWQDRQKIVVSGDEKALAEFDKDERTRNAYKGNISQRDYALLVEYHNLQKAGDKVRFLRDNASIGQNPRKQYLVDHPDDNAKLATFGQADAATLESYEETRRIVEKLDIPDSAVKDYLPPDSIAEEYYAYIIKLAEGRVNEANAILVKNPELYEYVKGEPLPERGVGGEGGPATEFFK